MSTPHFRKPVLEVIVCSVADAVAAETGGAHRLEVVSHFEAGGLTPAPGLVRELRAAVRLPLRVMVRESEGFAITERAERARLCAAARDFAALGVDGLVLGFLRGGGIDAGLLARVLACAPRTRATFHRAFEAARDPLATIARLKAYPQIDRILTGPGEGDWPERCARLARYAAAARPEIEILAGGGLDAAAIGELRAGAGLREFHVGRGARAGGRVEGEVEAARVRQLVSAIGL